MENLKQGSNKSGSGFAACGHALKANADEERAIKKQEIKDTQAPAWMLGQLELLDRCIMICCCKCHQNHTIPWKIGPSKTDWQKSIIHVWS